MNVLLVNDTSNYHCGSASVVKVIKDAFVDNKIISVPCVVPKINFSNWDSIDHIVVNGEGTLHNNRPGAVSILNLVKQGLDAGCTASIVNSIWQNMDAEWKTITDQLCVWNVRDRLSQQYAEKNFGRTPILIPDYSYFVKPETHSNSSYCIGIGGSFEGLLYPNFQIECRINIFDRSWNGLIEDCKSCRIVISGRHHELYASCIAETAFLPLESNSWKNQGLIANANSNLPVLSNIPSSINDIDLFFKSNHDEYQKIFDWLNQFTLEDVQAHLLTR